MKFLRQSIILLVVLSMLVSCAILPTTPSESVTTPSIESTPTTSTTTPEIIIPDTEDGPTSDPYVDMTEEEFYANYTPATSYMDAYYRTKHYFMSGSIEAQDQAPTISEYQPMEDGKYVRNTSAIYSEDGNTYYVIDAYGNIVNRIFKGAAYVTLEEVAAHLFAFGTTPANYISSKKGNPQSNSWGIYLRLNYSRFSGDTYKYPYEPVLPNISGCGGSLQYYEIDIGTTGTDCDPNYYAYLYNDGYSITRGAARIVYTVHDINGNKIIDVNEKFLFYTYNHYNDFQEYLNYQGGWGEMFGNITGGGTISSKYDYNPTPYVEVVRRDLYKPATQEQKQDEYIVELAFVYWNKKYFVDSTMCAQEKL